MQRFPRFALTVLTAVGILRPLAAQVEPIARDGKYYLYAGTSTGQGSGAGKGIYAYRFDSVTGKAEPIGLVAEAASASCLAVHPTQDYLYSADEAGPGAVTSFKIDRETGKLTRINTVQAPGSGLRWLAVDGTGKMLVSAHFGDGSFAAYPLKDDGSIGAPTETIKFSGKGPHERQSGPHTQSAHFSIDNRFLFVADFGIDRVMSYKVDAANAKLTPNNPAFTAVKPGTAPVNLSFHPSGRYAYLLNEITSAVTVFRYDAANGKLTEVQTIGTKPEAFTGNNAGSAILVHPSGMFVYAANRGDDSLTMFRVDETNGMLTPLGHVKTGGKTPRNIRTSPEGKWLLVPNQDSNTIVGFGVDQNTGHLKPTGETLPVEQPVFLKFVPVTDVPAGGRGGGRGRGPRGPGGPPR
jgi:6-phosphogluconolactonase